MSDDIEPFSTTPPKLLADANFNEHIVRGLLRLRPDMHITTAHHVGLDGIPDPDVLVYAAAHDLIMLTHDVRTMPTHFAHFLMGLPEGEYSPGVWYIAQTLPVGVAIQAILETWFCTGHEEHRNREIWLS